VRREQRLQVKRRVPTEASFEIVIWQDTSILTFRELQEEIPSKSESPQRAIHRTWRWDNVVPRSLIKETIQTLFEWNSRLAFFFLRQGHCCFLQISHCLQKMSLKMFTFKGGE